MRSLLVLTALAAPGWGGESPSPAPALASVAGGSWDSARLGQFFDAARARKYAVQAPAGAPAIHPGRPSREVHIEVAPRPSPRGPEGGAGQPGLVVPIPQENAAYRRAFRRLLDRPEVTDRYDELILKYADAYGLDPRLLKAIISAESEFRPAAVSPMGARGLMQVMPATAEMLGVPAYRLYEPEANIRAGAAYVARLFAKAWRRYKLDGLSYRKAPMWLVQRVIASYNAGPRFLFRDGGWYRETRHYVRKVLMFYNSKVTEFRRPSPRLQRLPTVPPPLHGGAIG